MSGLGMIASQRAMRPLSIDVRDERAATVDFVRDKMVEVDALVARGRVPAGEGQMLTRRLDAIADAIGQGLHR